MNWLKFTAAGTQSWPQAYTDNNPQASIGVYGATVVPNDVSVLTGISKTTVTVAFGSSATEIDVHGIGS